ncbi:MAG TPA: permease prefix domain 1-containing protein [Pseudonocardia sp.]|nr:permease prefix domain 1-containing protein [Pseudonocardia sp.]
MSADPIEVRVGELRRALRGPTRRKRCLLAEARDGLLDAAAAHRARGADPGTAARRAVAEFGTVAELAPGYQAELSAAQGRRTAVLAGLAFPGMTVGWDLLWSSGVSWGGPVSEQVRVMATAQDATAGAVAVAAIVGLVLLGLGARRGAPARHAVLAIGLLATLGALGCGGLAVTMNVLAGAGAVELLATNPTAWPAFAVSTAVMAVLLRSGVRSVRLARAG